MYSLYHYDGMLLDGADNMSGTPPSHYDNDSQRRGTLERDQLQNLY